MSKVFLGAVGSAPLFLGPPMNEHASRGRGYSLALISKRFEATFTTKTRESLFIDPNAGHVNAAKDHKGLR